MRSVHKWITEMSARIGVATLLGATLVLSNPGAAMAGGAIGIELNKLEQRDGACRIYLVFANATDANFQAFDLDLFLFAPDGVIAKRLALNGAPLPAGKTAVRLFDIQGLACAGIDRLLLNDVIACRDETGERTDCARQVEPASRAKARFIK